MLTHAFATEADDARRLCFAVALSAISFGAPVQDDPRATAYSSSLNYEVHRQSARARRPNLREEKNKMAIKSSFLATTGVLSVFGDSTDDNIVMSRDAA